MNRKFSPILLIAITSLLTACTQDLKLDGSEKKLAEEEQSKSQPVIFPDYNPSIADGKVVYERLKCAECHGEGGHGVGGRANQDMTDPNGKLAEETPIYQYKLLTYGLKNWDHPVLGATTSRREIWDLVFYIRSFNSPPLSTAELASIKEVFGANCADCHGLKGYGDGPLSHNLDPLPANFHQYNRFYDRDDPMLKIHISEGLYPSAMPGFLDREDSTNNVVFDEEYIDKLARYVRHFHIAYKSNYPEKSNSNLSEQK